MDPTLPGPASSARWRLAPRALRNTPAQILLAEDDDEMRELVADALRSDGHRVVAVCDGGRLLVRICATYASGRSGEEYDLIVTDIRMPVCDGMRILEELRKAHWPTPVILMTSLAEGTMRERAEALGAYLFEKPFDLDDLRTAATNLISSRMTRRFERGVAEGEE